MHTVLCTPDIQNLPFSTPNILSALERFDCGKKWLDAKNRSPVGEHQRTPSAHVAAWLPGKLLSHLPRDSPRGARLRHPARAHAGVYTHGLEATHPEVRPAPLIVLEAGDDLLAGMAPAGCLPAMHHAGSPARDASKIPHCKPAATRDPHSFTKPVFTGW